MAHRIEIAYKAGARDVPGEKLKKRIKRDMGLDVNAKVVAVYTIDSDLDKDILQILRDDAFVDPVIQEGYLDKPVPMTGDWAIEVGFKPGVTDNVGRTAKEVIESLSGRRFEEEEGVYTSHIYFLSGKLTESDIIAIAEGMLANTLINRYVYKSAAQYKSNGGMMVFVPRVSIGHEATVEYFP